MILWQISLTITQIKMECFNNYQVSRNKLYLSSAEIVSAFKKKKGFMNGKDILL